MPGHELQTTSEKMIDVSSFSAAATRSRAFRKFSRSGAAPREIRNCCSLLRRWLASRDGEHKSFFPPTIDAPQALALANEPKDNVER